MNNRFFFLINPAAGNGRAKKLWPIVQAHLENEGILFDFQFSSYSGEGAKIAQQVASKNYKCYVAVGGDGTFHEMINGLKLGTKQLLTAFVLPIGTGNDFVRMHQIPKWGPEWLQILQKFDKKHHNVGIISFYKNETLQTRYFVNVAGLFYDGYIVKMVAEQKHPIKSSFQYLLLILKYLFRYQPPSGTIQWDNKKVNGKFYTTNIGICAYSGGGMRLVPHANPFGKQFAITIAKSMHPFRVLFSTHFFYNGKVARHPKLSCFQTTKITITPNGDDDVLVEADGEFLGKAPSTVNLEKAGFWLLC